VDESYKTAFPQAMRPAGRRSVYPVIGPRTDTSKVADAEIAGQVLPARRPGEQCSTMTAVGKAATLEADDRPGQDGPSAEVVNVPVANQRQLTPLA
jgi:hypothetical protein